jgi:hypothetical protein
MFAIALSICVYGGAIIVLYIAFVAYLSFTQDGRERNWENALAKEAKERAEKADERRDRKEHPEEYLPFEQWIELHRSNEKPNEIPEALAHAHLARGHIHKRRRGSRQRLFWQLTQPTSRHAARNNRAIVFVLDGAANAMGLTPRHFRHTGTFFPGLGSPEQPL